MSRRRGPPVPPPPTTTLPPAPADVWALIQLVGETAALGMIEARGGTDWYIPHSLPADAAEHPLVKAAGEAMARSLVREYGGLYLEIPVARRWLIEIYRGRGMSHTEIALALRCSVDTVSTALRKARSRPGREGGRSAREASTKDQLDIFRDRL